VNTDLQFPATVLEMKRAGRRANVTPDPETRTAIQEPVTMSFVGPISDSARVRKAEAPSFEDAQELRAFLVKDGWKTPDTYDLIYARIPSAPAVYLFTVTDTETWSNGLVAYVGMSRNLRQRLDNHNILPLVMADGFHTMRWFKRVKLEKLRDVERKYISRFDPPWNIVGRKRGVSLCV